MFCLLPQPDGVGPHVLSMSNVVIAELGPGFRNGDPENIQGQAEVRWGAEGAADKSWGPLIQVILNLGMCFFDVPGYPGINLTAPLSFSGVPSTALTATKGPVEDSWPNPSLFFRHTCSQQGSVIFEKVLQSGRDRW